MGLEKAIEHGKEHRKRYRGSKRFDWSCRNHNGCPWCEGNRMYSLCPGAGAHPTLSVDRAASFWG